MKFNDEKQTNKTTASISPQSAMDDYFNDMFSAPEEDPLKKLVANDVSLLSSEPPSERSSELTAELSTEFSSDSTSPEKLEAAIAPEPELKRQPKKISKKQKIAQFEEPERQPKSISSLIIPAAFPSLAPAKPKQAEKVKLDSKQAIALLNKQKSKLSPLQKQRLKEKLKSLAPTKQETTIAAKTLKASPEVALKQEVVAEQAVPAATVKPVVKEKVLEAVADASSPTKAIDLEPAMEKQDLPDWANQRFECLLFSVAGLKLAVPLISLGAIYKIEKDFIPLVGRANWFMGLYHHLERNIRVIDTAQWVMPERCSDEVRLNYKFIIRLGGNDWGLACDAVHESIQLNPDQIKWRTERSKREWLYGTVIDHMCALIDVNSFSSILEQQASRNPSIFLN